MKFVTKLVFSILLVVIGSVSNVFAQKTVEISDDLNQHIFSYTEIEYLEDPKNVYSINEVSSPAFNAKFQPSEKYNPENFNHQSSYWYRIKIKHSESLAKNWIIEFYDQTIDSIDFFIPTANGFNVTKLGDGLNFGHRSFSHKNFEITLHNNPGKEVVYYFKVHSAQQADVIVVVKSVNWFISYALNEYFFFGLFYGMILIFCFYNLLMFFAVRESHYLYYIGYILSIGLYEMCADGIAYQFLWPNLPDWNQHAIGYSMYVVAVSALLFTRELLNVREHSKKLDNLLLGMLGARTLFFLACIFINPNWFNYKITEFSTLAVVFFVGIKIRLMGYRPARFYVLGYSFLFLGFIIKILIHFNVSWIPFGPVSHYFLSFCFLVEMICLSFAIGDKVRLLNNEVHLAQEETINQLRINEQLKDELNNELESKVQQKTHQLIEKSEFIEKQNIELLAANQKLQEQSEEIARINKLLESDNVALKTDVAKVTEARIMSKDVGFEEFSKMYPDKESCFRFLAEVKWPDTYVCRRCGHTHHCNGHSPYSRRCTKCSYDESVTAYTILQNTRIDITKAFYMIFLIYSSKGKISSHKLSEILDIRQSTCWAYSSKIKKVMKEKKKAGSLHESDGWSTLIMDEELEFSQTGSAQEAEV